MSPAPTARARCRLSCAPWPRRPATGARLHFAASRAVQRAHPSRRPADRGRRLDEVLTECEQANEDKPITFFEITTAAAYLAFSRAPADLAVIEVGMGGRLDATNVIDPSAARRSRRSATTTPASWATGSKDRRREGRHPEARRAGGDRPPARGERRGDRRRSGQARGAAVPHGREWQVTPTASGFRYQSDLTTLDLPAPALAGAHQIDNAATAVACIERLRAARLASTMRRSGKVSCSVEWPARLQKLSRGRWSRRCRRVASSGSTAATTRIAAWRSPAWRATGRRSRRRCRSISSSAC